MNGFEFKLIGNTLAFLALHIGMVSHWWRQRTKGSPNAWKTLKRLGSASTKESQALGPMLRTGARAHGVVQPTLRRRLSCLTLAIAPPPISSVAVEAVPTEHGFYHLPDLPVLRV